MKHICDYGCGQEAKCFFKTSRKYCCSKNVSCCPSVVEKIRMVRVGKNNPMYGKNHSQESKEKIGSKQRTPFSEIVKEAESRSYKILSYENEYKNFYTKLKFRCPEGHIFDMRWDSFHAGCKCRKCVLKENGRRSRRSFDKIVKESKNRAYKVLTSENEYHRDFPRKIKFRCPEGHIFDMRWDCFHMGQGCVECANIKKRIIAKRRKEEYGKQLQPNFNPEACKLIDEYGKSYGYNFQHALNNKEYYIPELGYWLDGYDKDKNVAIEVDESHHFNSKGELSGKDVQRQKEIEQTLGCKFIRLKLFKNEKKKE